MKTEQQSGTHRPHRQNSDQLSVSKRLHTRMDIMVLLREGDSPKEIADKLKITEAVVKSTSRAFKTAFVRFTTNALKTAEENREQVEKFEIEPELLHDGLLKTLEKITSALSSWDDASLDWLARNLENGELQKICHQVEVSGKTTPVASKAGSAWVAIEKLPPELAIARREAETARKRALRAQMPEDEKAEQRAKNAARMREKRRSQPQP